MRRFVMTSDSESEYEALDVLRKSSWESFDKRRAFEWKVCIALWTALATFIGIMITNGHNDPPCYEKIVAISAFGFIVISHLFWLIGLHRANQIDKKISFKLFDAMLKIINEKHSKDTKEYIEEFKNKDNQIIKLWNIQFQFIMTLILVVISILLLNK